MKKTLIALLLAALFCVAGCDNGTAGGAGSSSGTGSETGSTVVDELWKDQTVTEKDFGIYGLESARILVNKDGTAELYYASEFEDASYSNAPEGCQMRYVQKAYGTYEFKDGNYVLTYDAKIYAFIEIRGTEAEACKTGYLEAIKKDNPGSYEMIKQALDSGYLMNDNEGSNVITATIDGDNFVIARIESYDENKALTTVQEYKDGLLHLATNYDDGVIYCITEYDSEGEVLKEETYEDGKLATIYTNVITDDGDTYTSTATEKDADGNVIYVETYKHTQSTGAESTVRVDGNNNILSSREYGPDGDVYVLKEYWAEGNTVDEKVIAYTDPDQFDQFYYKWVQTDDGVITDYSYQFTNSEDDTGIRVNYQPGMGIYEICETVIDEHGRGEKYTEIPADEYNPEEWEKSYK